MLQVGSTVSQKATPAQMENSILRYIYTTAHYTANEFGPLAVSEGTVCVRALTHTYTQNPHPFTT